MVKHADHVHLRARLLYDQIESAWKLVKGKLPEEEFFQSGNPYFDMLNQLYAEEFPLAQLLDSSDLLVHAEGPGATDHLPRLDVITWLCETIGRNLRALVHATAGLTTLTDSALRKQLDLRLTGLAPGSLYAGFNLSVVGADDMIPMPKDDLAIQAVRQTLRALPMVSRYLTDTKVRPEMAEAFPDAAFRDATLMAALKLAPSGQRGIHTLEISSREDQAERITGTLDAKNRIVLRDTVRHSPLLREPRRGTFTGEVREIDLDAQRFKLKVGEDIGVIRCAFAFEVKQAKQWLGSVVEVTGQYEADAQGHPRMLQAEDLRQKGKTGSLFES
jgi:hypothetical protein